MLRELWKTGGIKEKVPLVSMEVRNERMNETDHAWQQGEFHQRTISQSRHRNMGCRPEVPFSTGRGSLRHFATASRPEVPGYQSTLGEKRRGSTELACASDDDLLLTGGDRPGSEKNGDEEGENGDGERGEGLHCWRAREREGGQWSKDGRAVIN